MRTLNVSVAPADLDVPGLSFHALKGDQAGRFSVLVSGNWRVTFGWQDKDAIDVDMEDYHGS